MKEEVPPKQEQIITDPKTLLQILRKQIARCITVQKTTTLNHTNLTTTFQHLAPTKSTMLQPTTNVKITDILNQPAIKDKTKLSQRIQEQNLAVAPDREKIILHQAQAQAEARQLHQVQAHHAALIQLQVQVLAVAHHLVQAHQAAAHQAVAVQVEAAEAVADNK